MEIMIEQKDLRHHQRYKISKKSDQDMRNSFIFVK